MNCKECPAHGKDHISELCVLRHNMRRGFCNYKDEKIYSDLEEFLKTDSRALNGVYKLPNYIVKEPTGALTIGDKEIIIHRTTILDGFDDILKKVCEFYKENNKPPIIYCSKKTFKFIASHIIDNGLLEYVHISCKKDVFYFNYTTSSVGSISCIIDRRCNKMKLGEYAICEE